MKPLVGPVGAWACTIISIFGIIILSFIAHLFRSNSHSVLGTTADPDPAIRLEIASSLMGAVAVYAFFLLFCGSQAWLHARPRRATQ